MDDCHVQKYSPTLKILSTQTHHLQKSCWGVSNKLVYFEPSNHIQFILPVTTHWLPKQNGKRDQKFGYYGDDVLWYFLKSIVALLKMRTIGSAYQLTIECWYNKSQNEIEPMNLLILLEENGCFVVRIMISNLNQNCDLLNLAHWLFLSWQNVIRRSVCTSTSLFTRKRRNDW